MNTQENRIKVFVNDSRENYSVLTYSENVLSFDEKVIDNIDHIDLSLCCSKGEDGRYYCIYNLYFVYLVLNRKLYPSDDCKLYYPI